VLWRVAEIVDEISSSEYAIDHRLSRLRWKPVIVEGFFDVMRLHQFGICHAVALMGSTLSEAQERLILETVGPRGRVTLAFDGDHSGQACMKDCLDRLSQYLFVRVVNLGENIQPDDLHEDEVKAIFG
jgi:DNA primase